MFWVRPLLTIRRLASSRSRRSFAQPSTTAVSGASSSSGADERERCLYVERLEAIGDGYEVEAAEDVERLKLGRRKGSTNQKHVESRRKFVCSVELAGVGAEYSELPALTHPEVALCGRSNCGKSSLLNALCGLDPARGVASVSHRPGWTQNFQLFACTLQGDEEPFMALLDLPGYGAAHASQAQRSGWARAMQGYLRRRDQLTCVFVLIDMTRGVVAEDHRFMSKLEARQIVERALCTVRRQRPIGVPAPSEGLGTAYAPQSAASAAWKLAMASSSRKTPRIFHLPRRGFPIFHHQGEGPPLSRRAHQGRSALAAAAGAELHPDPA